MTGVADLDDGPEVTFSAVLVGPLPVGAAEDAGGKVLLPRDSAFHPVALPGTLLDAWPVYTAPLLRATKVIGIAP